MVEQGGLVMTTESVGRDAMRALESLTPGGSEFHDSPHNCVECVKRTLDARWRAIIKGKRRERELQARIAELEKQLAEVSA